ncbi:hypothetical protein O3S73_019150 [Bacillus altitudinis]|nr:hypothetical protein [Bacillus altitudinis]MCY7718443.1 hypothetical protein [Bacillus altitudinis]MDR7671081.1 hypothetical protein [Bacillus altitudinis]
MTSKLSKKSIGSTVLNSGISTITLSLEIYTPDAKATQSEPVEQLF